MNCISIDIIQVYIDGEATAKETALIEKHITKCAKCAKLVDSQQQLASRLKNVINSLTEDTIEIPNIIIPTSNRKTHKLRSRRLFYSLAAACIIIMVLVVTQRKAPEKQSEITITYNIDSDYDANRTISQQQMVINIIDAEGNFTEYFIE